MLPRLATWVAITAALVVSSPAAAAECGGKTPCDCGDRVTRNMGLTRPVVCKAGQTIGLTLAPGVKLVCANRRAVVKCERPGTCVIGVSIESAPDRATVLQGCPIEGFATGIHATSGSVDLTKNQIRGSDQPILFTTSPDEPAAGRWQVIGNTITGAQTVGVKAHLVPGSRVKAFVMELNQLEGARTAVSVKSDAAATDPSTRARIEAVTIRNNKLGGDVAVADLSVAAVRVQNNRIEGATRAISITGAGAQRGTITKNVVRCDTSSISETVGIMVDANTVEIDDNTVVGCGAGAIATSATQIAKITNNDISGGFGAGICGETTMEVTNNVIRSGAVGIADFAGQRATVDSNDVTEVTRELCVSPSPRDPGACLNLSRGASAGLIDTDLLCDAVADAKVLCPLRFVAGSEADPLAGAEVLTLRASKLPTEIDVSDGVTRAEVDRILADTGRVAAGDDLTGLKSRSGGCSSVEGKQGVTGADGMCTGGLVAGTANEPHLAVALLDDGYGAPVFAGARLVPAPLPCGGTVRVPRVGPPLVSVTYQVTKDHAAVSGATVIALDRRFAATVPGVDLSDGLTRAELRALGSASSRSPVGGGLPKGVIGGCLSRDRRGPGVTGRDGRCAATTRGGARLPQIVIAFTGPDRHPTAIGVTELDDPEPAALIGVEIEPLAPDAEVCGNAEDDDGDGFIDEGSIAVRVWSQLRVSTWRGTRTQLDPEDGVFVMFLDRAALGSIGVHLKGRSALTPTQLRKLDDAITDHRLTVKHHCLTRLVRTKAGEAVATCTAKVDGDREYVAVAVRTFADGAAPDTRHVAARRVGKVGCNQTKTAHRLTFRLPDQSSAPRPPR